MGLSESHPEPSFSDWGTVSPAVQARPPSIGRGMAVVAVAAAVLAGLAAHLASGSGGTSLSASQATANAINLRLSDVPGFRVGNHRGVSESGEAAGAFGRCFGALTVAARGRAAQAAGARYAGSFSSPDFVEADGFATVSLGSQVAFASSSTIAGIGAVGRSPLFADCLARALAAITLRVHGVSIAGSAPTAATVPVPIGARAGVEPLLGVRATIAWSGAGIEIPASMDAYIVGVGRDELTLLDFSTGQPYPAGAERRLLSLIVGRALAEPH